MDSPERARARMVEALLREGRVRSRAVAEAMASVPRHLFLPGSTVETAYADEAVVTKVVDGVPVSSASQPSMVAIMLEQLELRPGQRVLEIGAGTGYNAALMARLVGPAGSVVAVDIDEDLVEQAAANLVATGISGVGLVVGDGAHGHPAGAPYDRIVLTVGSADVRPEWVAQLAPGGRLLLPLRVRGSQLSTAFDLGADGILRSTSVRSCSFIRLRGAGAGTEPVVALDDDGWSAELPAGARPEPLLAALNVPGPAVPLAVRLTPQDLWDGLGLWISLTDPRAFRLIARGPAAESAVAQQLLGGPAVRATVALPAGTEGFAAVVQDPDVGPAHARAFGTASDVAAQALAGLAADWVAAGRPSSADVTITAQPRGTGNCGLGVVELESSTLVVGYG